MFDNKIDKERMRCDTSYSLGYSEGYNKAFEEFRKHLEEEIRLRSNSIVFCWDCGKQLKLDMNDNNKL